MPRWAGSNDAHSWRALGSTAGQGIAGREWPNYKDKSPGSVTSDRRTYGNADLRICSTRSPLRQINNAFNCAIIVLLYMEITRYNQ